MAFGRQRLEAEGRGCCDGGPQTCCYDATGFQNSDLNGANWVQYTVAGVVHVAAALSPVDINEMKDYVQFLLGGTWTLDGENICIENPDDDSFTDITFWANNVAGNVSGLIYTLSYSC